MDLSIVACKDTKEGPSNVHMASACSDFKSYLKDIFEALKPIMCISVHTVYGKAFGRGILAIQVCNAPLRKGYVASPDVP
jgi:hypothetical protein